MKSSITSKQGLLLLSGVLLTVGVSYIPALGNHLVADSWVFVYPRSLGETLAFFHHSIIPEEWGAFWLRPLTMLFFWLDNVVWPGTEWGPHITNIVFHLINVMLVWYIVAYICGCMKNAQPGGNFFLPGFTAALFYGLHPLNVGSVGWVAARFDVMCVTCGLGGLSLWLRWYNEPGKMRKAFISVLLLIFAVLSKEQGVVFLVVCFLIALYGAFTRDERRSSYLSGCGVLGGAIVLCLVYRISVFGGMGGYITPEKGVYAIPPLAYCAAILFPYLNLFPGWSLTPSFWISSLILLVLFIFNRKTVKARKRTTVQSVHIAAAAGLSVLGFATTSPHAGIGFSDIMGHAESRFAIIAITGIALMAGIAVHVLVRSVHACRIMLLVLFVWGCTAAWRTDVQLQAWKDAGNTAHQIIQTVLGEAPSPPRNSHMLFYDIPRGNGQFAYIFGIGLREAILCHYPGRNDITILPRAVGKNLKAVDPDRDYVFRYNTSRKNLERLFPQQR